MVQRREDDRYSILSNVNSNILMSEERVNLFRATYGAEQAEIDFSTFKFRSHIPTFKGRTLICRVIQQIKVLRIKQNVLNRNDFEEYIRQNITDIYETPSLNYATISLYGISKYDNILGTIHSEEQSDVEVIDKDSFSRVIIEIDLQTRTESLNLEDTKDYTFLVARNHESIDDISRDLKNTSKNYKIVQESRELFRLTNKDVDVINNPNYDMNDSQTDNQSWSGSIESEDKQAPAHEKASPDALLKTGYPEIKKLILEQNEKVRLYYIINRKIYE